MAGYIIYRVGTRYGKLLVVDEGPPAPSGASWVCQCDCGNRVTVTASNLKRGQKACAQCGLSVNRADLTGRTFGRLTVIESAGSTPKHEALWNCQCACGTAKTVLASSLTRGFTRSCGCFALERLSETHTTHGMTHHPLHDVWTNMKQRCFNEKHPAFHRYGGRGVTVCERWMAFEPFVEDMFPTWQKGLTIEREDANGNYEPSNCVWASRKVQSSNKEKTIRAELNGELLTLPEIGAMLGIRPHTLRQRWHAGHRGEALLRPTNRKDAT